MISKNYHFYVFECCEKTSEPIFSSQVLNKMLLNSASFALWYLIVHVQCTSINFGEIPRKHSSELHKSPCISKRVRGAYVPEAEECCNVQVGRRLKFGHLYYEKSTSFSLQNGLHISKGGQRTCPRPVKLKNFPELATTCKGLHVNKMNGAPVGRTISLWTN